MDYSFENSAKIRREKNQTRKKVRHKISIIIFRVIVATVLIAGFSAIGIVCGAFIGIVKNSPEIDVIAIQPDIYPSIVYEEKTGKEIDRFKGEENREYVSFNKIPQYLKDAFVAIEDERFYTHNGVDLKGMFRAVYVNFSSGGERSEGASTITQQLIKNNIMKISRNTLKTKIMEQYLAISFEKKLEESPQFADKQAVKNHILEVYLNSINLHYSLNGVQTGALYYFGKDVSDLTLSESAVIAAITQNPSKNNPLTHPENNKHRQALILRNMLRLGMISQSEYDEAISDDVYTRVQQNQRITTEQNSYHDYFTDALIQQIAEDLVTQHKVLSAKEAYNLIYSNGLQIYSTQDLEMQRIMDEKFKDDSFFPASDFEIDVLYYLSTKDTVTGKVSNREKKVTVKKQADVQNFVETWRNELLSANDEIIAEKVVEIPQPQSAMVIMDQYNGHVKALTGGRGEKSTNLAFNRAVDSVRQPGSVFKVLASYAPGIDLGKITAATVLIDSPYTYEPSDYSPKNWYGGYRGAATVRTGIRDSMNVITVKNEVNIGIQTCLDYLINMGFKHLINGVDENGRTDLVPSLCLGGITNGVSQMELAAAYASIANLGDYNPPVLYTKVLNHDGTILLENKSQPKQIFKKAAAYILTDMMKDVITAGTGTQIRFQSVDMPVSGKTGTTTDTKDLMFTGYTPYYTASIWLGFDQPKVMREDRGYHMRLWRAIMEEIHQDLPTRDFEKPEGVVTEFICEQSGKLAARSCWKTRNEYFVAGTQPTEYCSSHYVTDSSGTSAWSGSSSGSSSWSGSSSDSSWSGSSSDSSSGSDYNYNYNDSGSSSIDDTYTITPSTTNDSGGSSGSSGSPDYSGSTGGGSTDTGSTGGGSSAGDNPAPGYVLPSQPQDQTPVQEAPPAAAPPPTAAAPPPAAVAPPPAAVEPAAVEPDIIIKPDQPAVDEQPVMDGFTY